MNTYIVSVKGQDSFKINASSMTHGTGSLIYFYGQDNSTVVAFIPVAELSAAVEEKSLATSE